MITKGNLEKYFDEYHKMSPEEARHLISDMLTLENPYHCPHGRPTTISMSKYELERKFKRIV